ncbi:MAG: oxidoreductase [Chitinophagales bacterium]
MTQSTWNFNNIPFQKGRIAIVTGANTGLGFETVLALAAKNMEVVLACRNMQKAEAAKLKILQQYSFAKVECMQIDLSSLQSVRAFAANFLKQYEALDLLINNAGIMIPPFSLTEDGFESQMGANYFGHFLLTDLLLETIVKTPNSRIVSLSSIAHKRGKINFDDLQSQKRYSAVEAYAQSKLACLMFAYELQRRLEKAGSKTLSIAAHPGISDTELSRHIPKLVTFLMMPVFTTFFTHKPAKGALPTLRAALDEAAEGGDYFGPNGWREFKGKPIKVRSTRRSRREDTAKRLWEVSEKLTGASYSALQK